MVTKTFICDLCKKSVGESELYPITITITRPAKSYNKMLSVAKDICKECLVKKDLLEINTATDKTDEEISVKSKSFESHFIDMLYDLGVKFED